MTKRQARTRTLGDGNASGGHRDGQADRATVQARVEPLDTRWAEGANARSLGGYLEAVDTRLEALFARKQESEHPAIRHLANGNGNERSEPIEPGGDVVAAPRDPDEQDLLDPRDAVIEDWRRAAQARRATPASRRRGAGRHKPRSARAPRRRSRAPWWRRRAVRRGVRDLVIGLLIIAVSAAIGLLLA